MRGHYSAALSTAAMPLPIEARNGRTAPPLGCKEKRHWPAGRQAAGSASLMIRYRCRAVAASSPLEDAGNYITKLPKAEHEAPGMRRIVLTCAILGQMIQHVPDAALQLSHQNKEGRVYGNGNGRNWSGFSA